MSIHFDQQTMFVICSSLTLVTGMCMLLVQLTGQPYQGFRHWTAGVLCQGVAFTLFAYSQSLPVLVSAIGGNVLYTMYPVLCSRGLRVFSGRTAPMWPLNLALAYSVAASYFFSAIHMSLTWRVAFGQLVIMPFFIDCGLLAWKDPAFRYPIVRRWLAATFWLIVLSGLIRVVLMFALEPERAQIWTPSAIQTLYVTWLTALSSSVAIALIVLNFQRTAKSLKEKERLLIEDVLARKKVEAALRESETRYRVLVETSPESVIVHHDGIIEFANPSAIRMFGGKSTADLVGRRMLDLVHPDSHVHVHMRRRQLAEVGSAGPLAEMRYLRLDGTPFEVECQSAPIVYNGASATQITAHDISELKRATAERQDFERKLLETQKLESLGILAGGIAHDFNNILTGILGNASLACLDVTPGSPIEGNLRAITEGSERAADLCRQMLAYSGKGNFVVRRISLNGLVEDTAHLLNLSISKSSELRFNLEPGLPAIEADATQIRQVIMNLVINASEAIGERPGIVTLRTGLAQVDRSSLAKVDAIFSQEIRDGEFVFLEVSDTGCGMDRETRARIFDPFFTTKFAGRGLGLAAVLGIVRGHKGALEIDSEPGRGTTFRLFFPSVHGEAQKEVEPRTAHVPWRGQGCILIVDDEEAVRTTAESMLRKLGFDVVLAANGAEGVKRFQAEPERFTLVIVDLMMPNMGGRQAVTEMRKVRKDLLFILTSGFNEKEATSRFSEHEAAGFLAKPFNFEDVSHVLRSVLPLSGESG